MIIGWFSLDTLLTVAAIPITMRLCRPEVAATQFTIYMALNNVGISLGAVLLGFSDRLGGLASLFPVLIVANGIALLILLAVRFPRRRLR
jgi:PAT family beta-lactamase induction signal transducer AmpG